LSDVVGHVVRNRNTRNIERSAGDIKRAVPQPDCDTYLTSSLRSQVKLEWQSLLTQRLPESCKLGRCALAVWNVDLLMIITVCWWVWYPRRCYTVCTCQI